MTTTKSVPLTDDELRSMMPADDSFSWWVSLHPSVDRFDSGTTRVQVSFARHPRRPRMVHNAEPAVWPDVERGTRIGAVAVWRAPTGGEAMVCLAMPEALTAVDTYVEIPPFQLMFAAKHLSG